jgi:hypothetical protein
VVTRELCASVTLKLLGGSLLLNPMVVESCVLVQLLGGGLLQSVVDRKRAVCQCDTKIIGRGLATESRG